MMNHKGFSLIEVLISVIVLGVGLLGIAGLHAVGLRNNHSALLRSHATTIAYDMADRIRANNQGFIGGEYDKPASTAVAGCSTTSGCTVAEMATNDMYEWSNMLSSTLPSGVGIICLDSTPDDGVSDESPACDGVGSTYAIKIWWMDDLSNAEELQRFAVSYL